jgi:hypothetical protein
MGAYTGPNTVLSPGYTTAFHLAALINPASQRAPQQLQRFATGNVPVHVPWPSATVTPTSYDPLTVPRAPVGR